MPKKFQKKQEDFICENCGFSVVGTGYTNHCPKCLFSKHVDNFPGDRENECQGLMEPSEIEKNGENLVIIHICQKCQIRKKNKVSKNDNQEAILAIFRKKTEELYR